MQGTWQWWVSQALGLVALVIVVAAFQMKGNVKLLIMLAISNVVGAGMQAFLGNWGMAAIAGLVVIRLFAYTWLNKRRERDLAPEWLDLSILFLFLWLNVLATIATAEWWFDWIFLSAVTVATWGGWSRNTHMVRITSVPVTIMILAAAFMFTNYMSIVTEVLVLGSIAIFYWRHFKAIKNPDMRGELKLITSG